METFDYVIIGAGSAGSASPPPLEAIAVAVAWSTLPSYEELKLSPNGQMIRVRAADGTVIISLGPSFGAWLPYDAIPDVMTDAIVSIEDRRYRWHPGVDPLGVARSLVVRAQKGHFTQGGSTITQQLARNVFLTNDKTWTRKFREIILALALEGKFSKDEILELYLNRVYFGGGAYGIDAASLATHARRIGIEFVEMPKPTKTVNARTRTFIASSSVHKMLDVHGSPTSVNGDLGFAFAKQSAKRNDRFGWH